MLVNNDEKIDSIWMHQDRSWKLEREPPNPPLSKKKEADKKRKEEEKEKKEKRERKKKNRDFINLLCVYINTLT